MFPTATQTTTPKRIMKGLLPDSHPRLLRLLVVYLMITCQAAYSTSPIRSVVVVGGTHGNEYTGVWCIRQWEAERQQEQDTKHVRYPTLDISTILGNPEAHRQNRRFIDDDLNRQFSAARLEETNPKTYEAQRARELDALLGPKLSDEPQTDLIVDLHSTTANMGITIIIPETDALMAQAAAYIIHRCAQTLDEGPDGRRPKAQILMHPLPNRHDRPNLGSVARHGLTIEVGPVPQGVLRHDVVQQTQVALHALLDFLERRNQEWQQQQQQQQQQQAPKSGIDGDRDEETVMEELLRVYPNHVVPCYRSAQAQRPGEMSGKITWPSSDQNPNFPAMIVHQSLQDRDFDVIRKGDPLFVQLDGTVVRYNGSHGDAVHVMFVNEGGYYFAQSGTGLGVAVRTAYDMNTGNFLAHDDERLTKNYQSFGEL